MADWTDQDINSLLPGEPWTSAKAIASFENPVAIAEAAPDAPIVVAGWHPHDGTIIGGSTGLIYDHAVDGTVTTIETPVLAAGFEYWLEWRGLTKTEGANAALTCDFRLSETGEYTITGYALGDLRAGGNQRKPTGKIFLEPQVLRNVHKFEARAWDGAILPGGAFPNAGIAVADTLPGYKADQLVFTRANATRIDRLRLVSSVADGIQGGQVYLLKRRFEGF